jgi:acyl-[acyl-carrier-protein]-phospholipid O-acyltransferase / long-chain-fatty-acid--[acyl-carrier-protein] ligase
MGQYTSAVRASKTSLMLLLLSTCLDVGVLTLTYLGAHAEHGATTFALLAGIPTVLLALPAAKLSVFWSPERTVVNAARWAIIGTLAVAASLYFNPLLALPAFALYACRLAFNWPSILLIVQRQQRHWSVATVIAMRLAIGVCAATLGYLMVGTVFSSMGLGPVVFMLLTIAVLQWWLATRCPETQESQPLPPLSAWFDAASYRKGFEHLPPALRTRLMAILLPQGMLVVLTIFAIQAMRYMSANDLTAVEVDGVGYTAAAGLLLGALLSARRHRDFVETSSLPLGLIILLFSLAMSLTIESAMGYRLIILSASCGAMMALISLRALGRVKQSEQASALIMQLETATIALATVVGISLHLLALQISDSPLFVFAIALVLVTISLLQLIFRLPWSMARMLIAGLTLQRHNIYVQGSENIPLSGGVFMLANHISWLDWAIVQVGCARRVRVIRPVGAPERGFVRWYFKRTGAIYINASDPGESDVEQVAQALNGGDVVLAFPEGTTSRTGHMGVFNRDYERVCQRCNDDVLILPLYLSGMNDSESTGLASFIRGPNIKQTQRDQILAYGAPLPINTGADLLKRRVFDLSISSWENYLANLPTVGQAWLRTAKRLGNRMVIADTLGEPLSAYRAMTAAICMGRVIAKTSPEQNVGVLMPTSAGGALANMAIALQGKTIVNLNYTANVDALCAAVDEAGLRTIYTSKLFLHRLSQRGIDLDKVLAKVNVVFLEDVKASLSKLVLLPTLLSVMLLPTALVVRLFNKARDPNATAAILFSSGSEGKPKGVMLSHRNIMGNMKQISLVLNAGEDDVVMASLPLFHAFGLTATMFLPLIEGMPMICHADPTDAVGVCQAVAKYRATLLFGTSTFFRLYTRSNKVHPLMLESVRLVVAGAEKLLPEVRAAFEQKFNKRLLEGYGATETTPVASCNLPDVLDTHYWSVQVAGKVGTVGMPLPGTSFKIVDPSSFEELPSGEAGMILIGGLQVMQGYLNNPEKTAEVIKDIDGTRWYVTGDKGWIDDDGFLTIVDRYSRFAKLGGEMVGLGRVESYAKQALGGGDVVVIAVNVPDDKKGEKIILLCDIDVDIRQLKKGMTEAGASALEIPAQVFTLEEMPLLGSGKTDFSKAKQVALACLN